MHSGDEQFRNCVKMIAALAYVPENWVQVYYFEVSRYILGLYPDMNDYLDYIHRTYVGNNGSSGGRYQLSFWNVYERYVLLNSAQTYNLELFCPRGQVHIGIIHK